MPERDGAGQHEKVFMHRALARLMFREETCTTIKNVEARQAEITLTDEFDKVVIEAVVEFLYTAALPSDLTCETALPLLRAAEFYKPTGMLEPLCAWLAENMQPLEAPLVFDAADCSPDPCLEYLRTEAMRLIARHLPTVLESGLFTKFPNIVKRLRFVPCEQAAFDVAKQIAESAVPDGPPGPEGREALAALQHVAFGAIPKPVLARHLAFIQRTVAASPEFAHHFATSLIRPSSRREYSLAGAILAVASDGAAFAFFPAADKLYHLPAIFPESETSAPAVCDAGLALAVVNGNILVVVLNDCNRQVYAYDEGRASWAYQGETRWHSVTNSAAAVSPDGRLVLLGGEHDVDADNDCEVRSTEGKWEYFRPLPEARSGGCAGFVGTDLYYVAGQHNEHGPADEVFVSPDADHQFAIAGRLNRPRWNFAAAFVDNNIYCFGGDFSRSSCEVYDVTTNTSRMIADAPSDGANIHSAWHRDGSVYVVERTRLLKYSIADDTWHLVTHNFPVCAKAVSFE